MNLEQIEQTLPNGLHDARINRITLDYLSKEAIFSLEICVSDSEIDGPERWRPATLRFSPFLYCIVEPPDKTYPYEARKSLSVDVGSDEIAGISQTKMPDELPQGAFRCWFFINDWNSFIHLAALDAQITFD